MAAAKVRRAPGMNMRPLGRRPSQSPSAWRWAEMVAFRHISARCPKSEMPLGGAFHPCRAYLCCLGACGRIVLLDCFLDPRGCFFQILEVHGRMEFDLRIESKKPGFGHRWNL